MSTQTKFDKVTILGVEIDAISTKQAGDYITKLAADPASPACYVIKPYVEFLDRAATDEALQQLLNGAQLAVADGVAVTWAATFLYAGPRKPLRFWRTLFQIVLAPAQLNYPLPDRAAGINFTWPLLEQAAGKKLKVFLVGKRSNSEIEQVAATVRQKIPGITIVGTASGHDETRRPGQVSPDWTDQLAEQIKAAAADVILVGMGFPLQEQVIAALAAQLDHGVLVGEGGTFDYEIFGGQRRKAPELMQRLGLEWLFRLWLEPSRMRRQLAIPRYIWRVWQSRR